MADQLFGVSSVVYQAYVVAWLVAVWSRIFGRGESLAARAARAAGSELRPFVLPSIVGQFVGVVLTDGFSWWGVWVLAMQVWAWWYTRNDWDDRWKKRGRRLSEKVRSLGHRLVVVPAGGGA